MSHSKPCQLQCDQPSLLVESVVFLDHIAYLTISIDSMNKYGMYSEETYTNFDASLSVGNIHVHVSEEVFGQLDPSELFQGGL